VQVDYGEGALTRVPGTERYRKPRLFVMTLRYSWCYFGGSCRYVVLDNLKEGVIKPDLYEPELNPTWLHRVDVRRHARPVADGAGRQFRSRVRCR
jgi:hypothetical protein